MKHQQEIQDGVQLKCSTTQFKVCHTLSHHIDQNRNRKAGLVALAVAAVAVQMSHRTDQNKNRQAALIASPVGAAAGYVHGSRGYVVSRVASRVATRFPVQHRVIVLRVVCHHVHAIVLGLGAAAFRVVVALFVALEAVSVFLHVVAVVVVVKLINEMTRKHFLRSIYL
ncbi:hypothetical protein M5689_004208 [Euphorbia peplus]|nr:hypothetical protein M5689_004208 [Euphorbia peplus]